MANRVAIAGGGLAGLTCAKYLADAGYAVTLYEGLPYFGGRASTYRDEQGDWVEQGLHLFLGTYSEFKALMRDVGLSVDQVIFRMDQVRFLDPEGPEAVYGTNPFSAPLKTALSFLLQNGYLGPIDKLSLLPLLAPGLADMDFLRREFDDQTVSEWWSRMNGSKDVMERFLRPFCRAIQFTDPDQFSAFNFLGWIHNVAYDLPHAYLNGYRGARDELIFKPLAEHLASKGVRLHTGVKLREIRYGEGEGDEAGRITGFVMDNGELVEADAYVAALPAWAFRRLVPERLRGWSFFEAIAQLPIAPAISVQLFFDRHVVDSPDFHLVGRSLTPVFQDQSTNAYPFARGDRLSVIVSPADDLLEKSDQELVMLTLKSLATVRPALWHAGVVKSVVLRHQEHLVRPLPGAMSARPAQVTPVPNLFLAGDWTQQEYFGSQEGGVRGGKACARAVVKALTPELRMSWLRETPSWLPK